MECNANLYAIRDIINIKTLIQKYVFLAIFLVRLAKEIHLVIAPLVQLLTF